MQLISAALLLVLLDQTPPQLQIPAVEIAVEVVGNLPLQEKVTDLSRRLARRGQAAGPRRYPPTILELITLVERNPEKPRSRDWNSITALSLRVDPVTKLVTVDYCIDHCGHDPKTGTFDPKRTMVSYRAVENDVVKRANKKLDSLKKYAGSPIGPGAGR